MVVRMLLIALTFTLISSIAGSAQASIVSDWNEVALQEVRRSGSLRNGPPIVARALAIVRTCIYEAWAAYDDVAIGTATGGALRRPHAEHTDANKAKAISFAAYRCLRNLYPEGTAADAPGTSPRVRLDAALTAFGYSLAETSSVDPTTAAGVCNIASQAIINFRANDNANQYGDLSCPSADPNRIFPTPATAAPLVVNGVTVLSGVTIKVFVAETCGNVPGNPPGALDDAPPCIAPLPCVGPGAGAAATGKRPYADYNDPATGYTSYMPRNPLMGFCNPLVPVCPAWPNPVTGLYTDTDPFVHPLLPWPNILDPNHWQPLIFSSHGRQTFVAPYMDRVTPFALTSADQYDHMRHIKPDIFKNAKHYKKAADEVLAASAGLDEAKKVIVEYWADGPESELPPGHWSLFAQFVSERDSHTIDQDAKMFFAMQNASFDAGIVGWHFKRKYDGVRPITAIRLLYDGKKVLAYGGPGCPTELIDGEKWMPYNPGTNLTPPFPGYISGHSVLSSASAVALKKFTGSDHFGFSTVIPAGKFDRVEFPPIPLPDTTLTYRTFSDAADDAALSRLLGGIHFSEDNITGVKIGKFIGRQAWEKAKWYFNGGIHRGHDGDDD